MREAGTQAVEFRVCPLRTAEVEEHTPWRHLEHPVERVQQGVLLEPVPLIRGRFVLRFRHVDPGSTLMLTEDQGPWLSHVRRAADT